jgi:fumarate hydratase class II
MKYKIEEDSLGKVKVPSDALYGAQSQRAIDNFQISNLTLPQSFLTALAMVKKHAALANSELGLLEKKIANSIVKAAEEIIAGKHLEQFPIDVFQTGSGTSTNMNMNEVLANLASKQLGKPVHPNDHINMGQSSNDVIPTTIHLSATIALYQKLFPNLTHLKKTISEKAKSLKKVCKTGRTHLMDAMPIRMEQELQGWWQQIENGEQRVKSVLTRLQQLAQGGTAIGSGINSHKDFAKKITKSLSKELKIPFKPSASFFEALSSQDTAVELSGALKTLAVSLMKIANDLRWMNSGPLTGLGEIELEALQPGSSIMPGKVNPVIPEAVVMVCAQVIGNDSTITIAGQSGNFQLNVMLPVIAYNILQSIEILSTSMSALADKAIRSFAPQEHNLEQSLFKNPILVTSLNPIIGYAKAASIAKEAYKTNQSVLDVAEKRCDIPRKKLEQLLDPVKLTKGGIQK